jgi:hypothetical protein
MFPFDITRIERAIEKAAEASNHFDISFVDAIALEVLADLNNKSSDID